MDSARSQDRREIEDCLLRYVRGVDRKNWELVRAAYHPDAHDDHGNYQGGIDGFIGDGKINYKPERLFETFYNFNVNKYLWLTLDYQRVANPAYNADRGPVNMYGSRVHAEF